MNACFKSHRTELDKQFRLKGIIGFHPKIVEVLELATRVADTRAIVLICGESGTGKELLARALHENSRRRDNPFVPLNCGAFPDALLESELFGYKKGAFTGAMNDKAGWLEHAGGGTVLLDEIQEMTPALQTKLLRVLQTGEFSPVGSTEIKRCDIRFIAATNKNLTELVRKGDFREELYYRLNVIDLTLPPLRERRSDIPLLVEHFWQIFSAQYDKENLEISPEVSSIMCNYDFPGNIRELKNIIERCVALTSGNKIETSDLPTHLFNGNSHFSSESGLSPFQEAKQQAIETFERAYIIDCLKNARGNISRAAQTAGIHVTNLHLKIKKYHIDPHFFKENR
jgi:transcriptional regulator with PAS, ATPase and Fis domain